MVISRGKYFLLGVFIYRVPHMHAAANWRELQRYLNCKFEKKYLFSPPPPTAMKQLTKCVRAELNKPPEFRSWMMATRYRSGKGMNCGVLLCEGSSRVGDSCIPCFRLHLNLTAHTYTHLLFVNVWSIYLHCVPFLMVFPF